MSEPTSESEESNVQNKVIKKIKDKQKKYLEKLSFFTKLKTLALVIMACVILFVITNNEDTLSGSSVIMVEHKMKSGDSFYVVDSAGAKYVVNEDSYLLAKQNVEYRLIKYDYNYHLREIENRSPF